MHQGRIAPIAACLLFLASPARSQTIAAWDFNDGDVTLVDQGDANNTANVITTTGAVAPQTDGSRVIANFTQLHVAETRYVQIPVDASDAIGVTRLRFVARSTASASKWWRVDLSVDGGNNFLPLAPLFEMTGSSSYASFDYELPGASGAPSVVVRLVATDENGDGTPDANSDGIPDDFVQADGAGTPGSTGAFKLDDLVIEAVAPEPDAGPQPDAGPDAGPVVVDAGPLPPVPVITEVAWMGSVSDSDDEWVELYNAGPDDIGSLASYVLVENGGTKGLPDVPLNAGAVVVIERATAATSLAPPEAQVPASGTLLQLTDTGSTEYLRVCPAGGVDDLAACDVARVLGSGWPAGRSTQPKRTMVRLHHELDGALASSWTTYAGDPSTVTDSAAQAYNGSPGEYAAVTPSGDGGVMPGGDGGVVVIVDAGPNAPPSLAITAPVGEVTAGGTVTVAYSATDPDGDDTVAVALYYDVDESGFDGVLLASGLPGGTQEIPVSTALVPPGTWRLFGIARDHRGEAAHAYAQGSIVVEGGPGSDEATLQITDPDGVNDGDGAGRVTIRWELGLPALAQGSVSLFYDVDDSGLDGEPIIGGLAAFTPDGEEGARAYLWDTASVPAGSYTVYGVLDWTGGSVSDYSESAVSVGGGGCACSSEEGSSSTMALALFAFTILLVPRARRRTRGRQRC